MSDSAWWQMRSKGFDSPALAPLVICFPDIWEYTLMSIGSVRLNILLWRPELPIAANPYLDLTWLGFLIKIFVSLKTMVQNHVFLHLDGTRKKGKLWAHVIFNDGAESFLYLDGKMGFIQIIIEQIPLTTFKVPHLASSGFDIQ